MTWEGSHGGWGEGKLYASSAGAGKCLLRSCLGWVLFLSGAAESLHFRLVIQIDVSMAEEGGEGQLNTSDGKQSLLLTEVEVWR